MADFAKETKKDLIERLKAEIETAPKEKLADTVLNIIVKGKDFGLDEDDMKILKESFKKRLKEAF
jgi:hypothetical protein